MNIAIYGKGGIGKSTIASNIAAFLGYHHNNVLLVGCDPKSDSTILLSGSEYKTLLEQINDSDIKADCFLKKGKYHVDCIEMGGPAPGVGCAGRGIISGIKILSELKIIDKKKYDYVIFDILGDVVCGGFFEPLKSGFVDVLYIVTSGEFNSLFAANNLCRGYVNCRLAGKGVAFGGIIANCRGIQHETEIITSFCDLIGVPLVCTIPRDGKIEMSTFLGKPIVEMMGEDPSYKELYDILNSFSEYIGNNQLKTTPQPVSLP
ncbi:MAG: AAA family ATPase, partial [Lachnospiraceae bacterium]|nr:AAA family ATPase [Lachnospiraceae bacterium]